MLPSGVTDHHLNIPLTRPLRPEASQNPRFLAPEPTPARSTTGPLTPAGQTIATTPCSNTSAPRAALQTVAPASPRTPAPLRLPATAAAAMGSAPAEKWRPALTAARQSLDTVQRQISVYDADLAQRLVQSLDEVTLAISQASTAPDATTRAQQINRAYEAMIALAFWINSAITLGCVATAEVTPCKTSLEILARQLNEP